MILSWLSSALVWCLTIHIHGVLTSPTTRSQLDRSQPRPLVLWHGLGPSCEVDWYWLCYILIMGTYLGDSHSSPGMLEFASMIKGVHPGIFVHSVYIEEDLSADRRAGFVRYKYQYIIWLFLIHAHPSQYGNVNEQIAKVAEQIASIEELRDGFDAMGLSQGMYMYFIPALLNGLLLGGQFLRAYVERFNTPRVHNLITFGSQHLGVSEASECRPTDFLCLVARRAIKGNVYSKWAQNNLIQVC